MLLSSPQFCDRCGATNRPQAQFCRVCCNALPVESYQNFGGYTSFRNDFLPAQTCLRGRYIIHSLVGRGGYGAVYKAIDTVWGNRFVAIKEMSRQILHPHELVAVTEAFLQEALLLATLTHPNMPRIYEQFDEAGRLYLVMDFIEGETLEQMIRRQPARRFPVESALNLALQLCSVLEYLHTRQPPIIFRDLKPANIMITPAGQLFLIDFGIARHFKPGQQKDTFALGSTGYAPPEQYGKAQTTTRADIYSLGATLHQLLTGRDPSENPFHFSPFHANDPSLRVLERLLLRMVSLDIGDRPSSVALVRQELQYILSQYRGRQTSPLPVVRSGLINLPNAMQQRSLPHSLILPSPSAVPVPVHSDPSSMWVSSVGTNKSQRSFQSPRVYPQASTLFICLGHASRITSVAWSPNGAYLASSSFDKTIHIWDGNNGRNLSSYKGHSAHVNDLAWSPDSRYLVSASDDWTVRIWDGQSGKHLFTYDGHKGMVFAVSWSPDGNYIASAGEDRIVHVWHSQTGRLAFTYADHSDQINTVSWSPDSRLLASGGKDRILRIREIEKCPSKQSLLSQILFPHQGQWIMDGFVGQLQSLAWSPDGRRIAAASADSHVRIRDAHTGMQWFDIIVTNNTIKNSVSWSPNGRYLAIGGSNKLVRIWDLLCNKEMFSYSGHNSYVICIAWAPDGTRIASAGVDRSIQVWQAP
jgi:WD40 repeat protein